MAHFAELDENNVVSRVIVINNDEIKDVDGIEHESLGIDFCVNHYGGRWIQTSYNGNIRGKYAGIGDTYNEDEDIFMSPQPWPSWIRQGSGWIPPIPYPSDGGFYQWNESAQSWDAV